MGIDEINKSQLHEFRKYLQSNSELFQAAEELPASIKELEITLPDLDEWRNINEQYK